MVGEAGEGAKDLAIYFLLTSLAKSIIPYLFWTPVLYLTTRSIVRFIQSIIDLGKTKDRAEGCYKYLKSKSTKDEFDLGIIRGTPNEKRYEILIEAVVKQRLAEADSGKKPCKPKS